MTEEKRIPIAYVEAVVMMPLYDGDQVKELGDWFYYCELGINEHGKICSTQRPAKLISQRRISEE